MKYSMIILSLLLSASIFGQTKADIMDAIGSGDANAVAKYMDQNVEVCFDDQVEFLSKPEAVKALAAFYDKNAPLNFNTLHQGDSKGKDSKYMIGNYKSENGNKFRVYVFAKAHGTRLHIQEVRFDIQK